MLFTAAAIGSMVLVISRSQGSPASVISGIVLAVLVIAVLMRIDVSLLQRRLEDLRAALPVLAFVVFTSVVTPSAGTKSFDEIGAQVIVVLLLALAIDARFFRLQTDRDRLDIAAVCFTMLLLATGEFYALKGIFTQHPAHGEIVAGAIAAGFVAVAVTALAGSGKRALGDS